MLYVVHGLVIENLVGLGGIVRARRFIDLFLSMEDLCIALRGAQQEKTGYRQQKRPPYGREECQLSYSR
jgi:hypothetical protein